MKPVTRVQSVARTAQRSPSSSDAASSTPAKTLRTISFDEIHPSMCGVTRSPFLKTGERITGSNPASYYYIGADGNNVVFWYRDFTGAVRNQKVVQFHENGFNRRKDVHPYTIKGAWMPFWGEEWLEKYNRTILTKIFFVESEKTAIYCQIMFREALWLGCGGSNGCTRGKIERVKHLLATKNLFVLFDNDDGGKHGTTAALKAFKQCGLSASVLAVSDIFPNADDGMDMADCIVAIKGGL